MREDDQTSAFFVGLYHKLGPGISNVGPYQVLHEIAHGGQGVVYKGIDSRDNSFVAIKRPFQSSGNNHDKLLRGTKLVASLNHPNILPVSSIENQSGNVVIVTPWIDGTPVDVWSKQSSRTITEKIAVFVKICSAVSHAHFRGVIHRDLKPSNILIRENGTPCILDFGIAKSLSNVGNIAQNTSTLIAGDIGYLPPEVLNQTDPPADIRQDVYSLGVLLYLMLVGTHPLDGETASGSFSRVAAGGLFTSNIDRLLPGSLGPIIRKATSLDLNARYSTANELVEDIKDDQKGLPVRAIVHTKRYLLSTYLNRHKKSITVVMMSTITLFFGVQYLNQSTRIARDLRDSNSHTIGVLSELVEALGPTKELGPNANHSSILLYVSNRIENIGIDSDADLMLASASLHASMARSFLQIKRETLGIHHAQESYKIYHQLLGIDSEQTQLAGALVARLHNESLNSTEAESLSRYLIGDVDPEFVGLDKHLLNLAVSLIRQMRLSEARPYLDEFLMRAAGQSEDYAEGLEVSAIYYNNLDQPKLGLRDSKESERIRNSLFGPMDARTITAQLLQVKSLQMLGQFQSERMLLLEILPRIEQAFGSNDPRNFQATAHLAISEMELGHAKEALLRAEKGLAGSIEQTGVHSWLTTQFRFLVARALLKSDRPKEVVDLLEPEIERVNLMANNRVKARHLPRLWVAEAYNDLGMHSHARSTLEPAIVDLRNQLGSSHRLTLQFEYELIRTARETLPEEEFRSKLKALSLQYSEVFGLSHPYTILIINDSSAE